MMTFAQAPDAEQFPAEYRERIMHACLNLGDGVLMASDSLPDTCGGGPYEGIKGCSVSLHPTSVDESEKLFAALAERSEEHTSELQSLMRIPYAVFCMINNN